MRDFIVVLVDDDTDRAPNFRNIWKNIIRDVFSTVDVRLVTDIDAVDDILKGRPHVLVIDNVFVDKMTKREVPNRGLDFIVQHKDKYPDCVFLLYTGKGFQIDTLGNKFPNPDLLVTKISLSNAEYQRYISRCISERVRRLPIRSLTFLDAKDAIEVEELQEDLQSIAEQCLLVVQDRDRKEYIRQVNLRRLAGGYSGSLVYLADVYGAERYHNLPFVLKVTPGVDVSNEVSRYNSFARLQMPHDMRVDLIGSGCTGDYSGAIYSFAFGRAAGIASATNRIKGGDFAFIDTVITKLFLSTEIGWYKTPQHKVKVENFYSNSEEYAPSKDGGRLDGLRNNAFDIFSSSDITINEDLYSVGSRRWQHIRRQLGKFYDQSMPETICHGDFNSNNIILSSDSQSLSVIDFEYTGFDCFYKDFISLESSVRAYWNDQFFSTEDDCWTLYEAEQILLNGGSCKEAVNRVPAAFSYFEIVQKIRGAAEAAAKLAGLDFKPELYALALAFHMLKLNGLRIWDASAKIKLMACLFATADRLERLS